MRTKAHRYSATVSGTFTNGTDCIGVTGDFDGGFVQANGYVYAVPGAGGWISARFKVDGISQAQLLLVYQSGADVTLVHPVTLRVPQGRHRVSVLFGTSAAPIASCTAELSVAELNA